MSKKQRIYANAILRAANTDDDKMVVEGYALKFNKTTTIGGWWSFDERIDPKAMDDADISDVILNFNHDTDAVLARTTASTLTLETDEIGLKIRAELVNTQVSRDVFELIRTDHITQMSFAVEIKGEEWVQGEDGENDLRTITNFGRFYDVSAVTFPAYQDTEILAASDGRENLEHIKAARDAALTERNETMNKELIERLKELGLTPEDYANDAAARAAITAAEAQETPAEPPAPEPEARGTVDVNLNITTQPQEVPETRGDPIPNLVEQINRGVEGNEADSPYATAEYRNAWLESIRRNDNGDYVRRYLSTLEGSGDVLVPTMIIDAIETEVRTGGRIAALCKHFTLKNVVKFPREESATDAAFHDEGTAAPDQEVITFGEVLLNPKMIKKWIEITDELNTMAIEAFGDYLVSELANKVLKALDDAIIAGASADNKGVIGVIDNENTVLNVVTALDWTTGYSALGNLGEGTEDTAVAVLNRQTFFQTLLTQKDTTGQPIAAVTYGPDGKPRYTWSGLPVKFSDQLKNWATASSGSPAAGQDPLVPGDYVAIIGDFSGYTLNFPNGYAVDIKLNPYIKDIEDLIRYVAKLYVAGNVTGINKFAAIRKGN
jgi:HK97 family phage major capsid protein/HK97 family phage prohead protease